LGLSPQYDRHYDAAQKNGYRNENPMASKPLQYFIIPESAANATERSHTALMPV
jgi:hypothetical protein